MKRYLHAPFRGFRPQPVTWVLGTLAFAGLALGTANVFVEIGPQPAGAERPVPEMPDDVLACGKGQPRVGAVIDHLAPPPGQKVVGPTSPEAALAGFLEKRFPGLATDDFELTNTGERLAKFVRDTDGDSRIAEITVTSGGNGTWQVAGFRMCHSLYDGEVQR